MRTISGCPFEHLAHNNSRCSTALQQISFLSVPLHPSNRTDNHFCRDSRSKTLQNAANLIPCTARSFPSTFISTKSLFDRKCLQINHFNNKTLQLAPQKINFPTHLSEIHPNQKKTFNYQLNSNVILFRAPHTSSARWKIKQKLAFFFAENMRKKEKGKQKQSCFFFLFNFWLNGTFDVWRM